MKCRNTLFSNPLAVCELMLHIYFHSRLLFLWQQQLRMEREDQAVVVEPSYSKFAKQCFRWNTSEFFPSHFPSVYIIDIYSTLLALWQMHIEKLAECILRTYMVVSLKFEGTSFKQDRTASTVWLRNASTVVLWKLACGNHCTHLQGIFAWIQFF